MAINGEHNHALAAASGGQIWGSSAPGYTSCGRLRAGVCTSGRIGGDARRWHGPSRCEPAGAMSRNAHQDEPDDVAKAVVQPFVAAQPLVAHQLAHGRDRRVRRSARQQPWQAWPIAVRTRWVNGGLGSSVRLTVRRGCLPARCGIMWVPVVLKLLPGRRRPAVLMPYMRYH